MKFSSTESITALRGAQEREHEAVSLYEKCFSEALNESVRTVLAILVQEEQKHFEIVSALIAEAEAGTSSSIKVGTPGEARQVLAEAFGHVSMSSFASEKATVDIMLEQALANENESFDLYSRLASAAEQNETAAVYRYLAQQENKHFNMVNNLLNFLGDPSRWLYEEENLIFHL
jgi:rubrerythrin